MLWPAGTTGTHAHRGCARPHSNKACRLPAAWRALSKTRPAHRQPCIPLACMQSGGAEPSGGGVGAGVRIGVHTHTAAKAPASLTRVVGPRGKHMRSALRSTCKERKKGDSAALTWVMGQMKAGCSSSSAKSSPAAPGKAHPTKSLNLPRRRQAERRATGPPTSPSQRGRFTHPACEPQEHWGRWAAKLDEGGANGTM